MYSNLQQIKELTIIQVYMISFHNVSERHFYFGAFLETKKKTAS